MKLKTEIQLITPSPTPPLEIGGSIEFKGETYTIEAIRPTTIPRNVRGTIKTWPAFEITATRPTKENE